MKRKKLSPPACAEILAKIATADLKELRQVWLAYVGLEPAFWSSTNLLRAALAFELQTLAYGDLKPKQAAFVKSLVKSDKSKAQAKPYLASGTKLIRAYQGKTIEVEVQGDAFIWNKQNFKSLSAIAKAATGTSWNGWRFFGLKKASNMKGDH